MYQLIVVEVVCICAGVGGCAYQVIGLTVLASRRLAGLCFFATIHSMLVCYCRGW